MSEKRFIELINLRIDGEISEEELAELEREIALSPRRKEIFDSYQLLQEASHLVCSQFGEALSKTVDLRKYQIVARESRGWQRGFRYSVGAVAAACAAVAAAVAFFPETDRSNVRTASAEEEIEVEVYNPQPAAPGSGSIAARPVSTRRPEAEYLSFSSPFLQIPTRFESKLNPPSAGWSSSILTSSSSSTALIRSSSSFEGPRPASFEFTR